MSLRNAQMHQSTQLQGKSQTILSAIITVFSTNTSNLIHFAQNYTLNWKATIFLKHSKFYHRNYTVSSWIITYYQNYFSTKQALKTLANSLGCGPSPCGIERYSVLTLTTLGKSTSMTTTSAKHENAISKYITFGS